MPNDFYNHDDGYPAFNAQGSSAAMRLELDKIAGGFDKFPVLSGNGGKILAVNVSATGLEYLATTGTGNVVRANDPTFVLTDTTTNNASPAQHGWLPKLSNSGMQFLSGLGTWVSAAGNSMQRSMRTSNTILSGGDNATFIDITSGTFTQTFTAAATLGPAWYCYYRNAGTGDITMDPNGAELIDGLASYVMYPGEVRLIGCDGTGLYSTVLRPFSKIFTANGTFVSPPGYQYYAGDIYGGGGSGGKSGNANNVGGAGGAAGIPFNISASLFGVSQSVVVGAGAAGVTASVSGGVGNTSSIGTLVFGYGGGGSASGSGGVGGGGGGALSAGGTGGTGGSPGSPNPNSPLVDNSGFGGAAGGSNLLKGGDSAYGGSGGAAGFTASTAGNSVWGGAGGGGVDGSGVLIAAGVSKYGGSGGAAGDAVSGSAGSIPGGGGGGTRTGTTSGAGGRGEVRIRGGI